MRGRRRILFLFKLGANEQRRISSKACESARAAAVGLKKNCRVARLFFFFIYFNESMRSLFNQGLFYNRILILFFADVI